MELLNTSISDKRYLKFYTNLSTYGKTTLCLNLPAPTSGAFKIIQFLFKMHDPTYMVHGTDYAYTLALNSPTLVGRCDYFYSSMFDDILYMEGLAGEIVRAVHE